MQPQLPGTAESHLFGRPRALPLYPIASTFSSRWSVTTVPTWSRTQVERLASSSAMRMYTSYSGMRSTGGGADPFGSRLRGWVFATTPSLATLMQLLVGIVVPIAPARPLVYEPGVEAGWHQAVGALLTLRGAHRGAMGTTIPTRSCLSVARGRVAANTHALNLLPNGSAPPPVDHIPLYEVYMRMAEELAKRSTCVRLQVGTVVTDQRLENVLAIGYNGNARGLPNKCDSAVPGSCGCIHSEMNALVKAPGSVRDKVVFVSASPCVMCAKLIINSGVTHVFYRKAYRDPSGIEVLAQGKVTPVLYDKWVGEWR